MLLVAVLAGCGGDDDEADQRPKISGTFVGKVSDTDALVAVVTPPPAGGQNGDKVTLYVSDPGGTAEVLSATATDDGFSAASEDDDARAEGELSDGSVSGTIELDGEEYTYEASEATATAGLYDLTVSSDGKLRGASAAGVGLEGESTIPSPGSGSVKLADGTRLDFEIEEGSGDAPDLQAGGVRMIVLPGGTLSGAAMSRPAEDGGSKFLVLSSKSNTRPRAEG